MPEHSFHSLLPTWPEETRAYFSQPHLRGDYFDGDLSIRLYGFEAEPLKCVHVEVRGNGNPLPVLAAICVGHGWVVIDSDAVTPVDLTTGAASDWEEFSSASTAIGPSAWSTGRRTRLIRPDPR
jgi:hypothetical protein